MATSSVPLSRSQFTHLRHTVEILLVKSQSSSHKICEVIEPVASFSQLLLSSREQFYLQQNRLHQVQNTVSLNDYYTFQVRSPSAAGGTVVWRRSPALNNFSKIPYFWGYFDKNLMLLKRGIEIGSGNMIKLAA